jgi:hypothetical protein
MPLARHVSKGIHLQRGARQRTRARCSVERGLMERTAALVRRVQRGLSGQV